MFKAVEGGLIALRPRHIAAIYDEAGQVRLATVAGTVHALGSVTVQQAVAAVSAAGSPDHDMA